MKPLSKRYLKIEENAWPVTAWLAERQKKIDTEVASVSVGSDGFDGGCLSVVFLIFACGETLIFGTPDHVKNPGAPYPWGTVVWFLLVFGGIGITGLVRALVRGSRNASETRYQRENKRCFLETELDNDSFHKRAKLINEAVREYKLHCNRYVAWYEAVDEGLQNLDEELADRYHAFIVKAHGAIEKAIANFTGAVEMSRRQAAFQESHKGLLTEPTGTALTELITRLDQPVEVPRPRILEEPTELLEQEEAAADLESFLGEKDLAAQIDALAGGKP